MVKNTPPMDEDMVCVCSHANPFFVTDANATTKNDRKNILFKKCSIVLI